MFVRKNSLSYGLLTAIEKSIEAGVLLADYMDHPGRYVYGGYDGPLPKGAIYKAIKRLKEKGIIELSGENEELILKLTDFGRIEWLLLQNEPILWDGKWRVVIFDIPEQQRKARNLFRRNLKIWGFKQLQKSVWISKKDILPRLSDYIVELKIEKWVLVFETTQIGPTAIT